MNIRVFVCDDNSFDFYVNGRYVNFLSETECKLVRLLIDCNFIPECGEVGTSYNFSFSSKASGPYIAVAILRDVFTEDFYRYSVEYNGDLITLDLCNSGLTRYFGEIPEAIYLLKPSKEEVK